MMFLLLKRSDQARCERRMLRVTISSRGDVVLQVFSSSRSDVALRVVWSDDIVDDVLWWSNEYRT